MTENENFHATETRVDMTPPMTERERSIFAWAKAARTKGSGLPPSRALRWIDELGDRLATLDSA